MGRAAIVGITDKMLTVSPYDDLINKEAEIIGVSDHTATEIRETVQAVADAEVRLTDAGDDADARRRALEALRTAMRKRLHLLREVQPEIEPITLAEIQALLAGSERLVAYNLSDRGSCVLVVSPEKVRAFPLEDARHEDVAAYAQALARPGAPTDLGRRLFRALVPQALWAELRGASHVHIVPHGILHRLPFETLVVDDKGTYWVDAGPPVSYVSSGSVLAQLRRRRAPTSRRLSIVVAGDPVFARTAAWPAKGSNPSSTLLTFLQ